jgi:NADPH:quinone reductase-like Zn-dependent oxidoreductase
VDLVGSLGADRVVDYTKEDFTRGGQRYDVLLDIAGSKSWRKCKRVLEPGASLVIVGGPMGGPFLGPLGHVIRTRLAAIAGRRKVVFFIAKFNRPDMNVLRELVEAGKVRPVVERRYDLAQAPEALRYMGEGHVQSKLVITV